MEILFLTFLLTITTIKGVFFMSTNQNYEISEEIVRKVDKIKEKLNTFFSIIFALALFIGMSILLYKGVNFIALRLNIQATNGKIALFMLLSFIFVVVLMLFALYGNEIKENTKRKYAILFTFILIFSANTSFSIMYFIGSFLINL